MLLFSLAILLAALRWVLRPVAPKRSDTHHRRHWLRLVPRL